MLPCPARPAEHSGNSKALLTLENGYPKFGTSVRLSDSRTFMNCRDGCHRDQDILASGKSDQIEKARDVLI